MLNRHGPSRTWRRMALGLLVAAAVLVAVLVPYRSDIADARARIAQGSKVANTACGPIEYADVGQGLPVLVAHGAGGGFDQGLDIAGDLAGEGFRVIAVSRFGYLRTPMPPDASAEAQARAHACLLDTLGIDTVAVMGASAGAPSSMQFALQFPQRTRRLVLMVPAVYVPRAGGEPSVAMAPGTRAMFETALRSDFLMWAAIQVAPGVLTRALLATPPAVVDRATQAEKDRVEMTLDHILPVSARRKGLLNDAAITTESKPYPLERITAPTLAVSAADDLFGTFDSARYTVEHIKGARLLGFDDGGHVLVGRQDEVRKEMATFLR